MKIARVKTTPLAVPLARPYRWRSGAQHGANLVLFSVETDEGLIGYGESICEDPAGVEAYGHLMTERFVGRSPGEFQAVLGELWREGRSRVTPHWTSQILSGLEMACWDALGKALGVPASTFLGGGVREEVDFMGFPQGKTPEELAREAADLVAQGYRVIYVKIGRPDAEDEAIVAAVREAIGSEPLLRVDPNEAWDVPTAVERIRQLEPYGIDWVEQPVAAENVAGLAYVRRRVQTKIAADQAIFTTSELRSVLEQEAADAIVIGTHETAGLWRLREMAYLADAYGIPVNWHAWVESAISTFAGLQVMACVPNLTLGNQVMHTLLAESLVAEPPLAPHPRAPTDEHEDRDLVHDAAAGTGGRVAVPRGPGLGFELNLDAVERAHERYLAHGRYASVESVGGAASR